MHEKKPNILFLLTDQWRGDCLGHLGEKEVNTPHLDRLAQSGTLFTHAYSNCPVCIPARATLATGMSPYATGRLGYEADIPWDYADTYMERLRSSNYQTLQVGKTHFCPHRIGLGFERLTLYEAQVREEGFESDYHQWLREETQGQIQDTIHEVGNNGLHVAPWQFEEKYHPTAWTARTAAAQLKERDRSRPYLMQVSFQRPHCPFDPPVDIYNDYQRLTPEPPAIGDWAEKYSQPETNLNKFVGSRDAAFIEERQRAYYGGITFIDQEIGRLLASIEEEQADRETYILFSSDHGEMLGDHYHFQKSTAFQGAIHIPLIIAKLSSLRSGKTNDSQQVSHPVSLADIMPTLLDMAQLEHPPQLEGRSLYPFLENVQHPFEREYLHGEISARVEGWQWIVSEHYKFVWETVSGQEYFFDLKNDPQEINNLIHSEAMQEHIIRYRNRLIGVLSQRSEKSLTDGHRLIAGSKLPRTLPWLKERKDAISKESEEIVCG